MLRKCLEHPLLQAYNNTIMLLRSTRMSKNKKMDKCFIAIEPGCLALLQEHNTKGSRTGLGFDQDPDDYTIITTILLPSRGNDYHETKQSIL
jgi:hypothetical protein